MDATLKIAEYINSHLPDEFTLQIDRVLIFDIT